MRYSLDTLLQDFEAGRVLEFLFFWGHTNKNAEKVGKQCLSQWFEASFIFDNIIYRTAEHWMMARKALLFNDKAAFEEIIESESPKKAKEIGRRVKNFGPSIWDEYKYGIVIEGNLHKFTQNAELFEYLKSTKDKYLIEASPSDRVWGIGVSENSDDASNPYAWTGQNLLGFALMEVRSKISKMDYFKFLKNPFMPPWKKYPDVECGDLFFRMGAGEGYAISFWDWFNRLSETDKEIFKITFPPENGWERVF